MNVLCVLKTFNVHHAALIISTNSQSVQVVMMDLFKFLMEDVQEIAKKQDTIYSLMLLEIQNVF